MIFLWQPTGDRKSSFAPGSDGRERQTEHPAILNGCSSCDNGVITHVAFTSGIRHHETAATSRVASNETAQDVRIW
jgi:hypothetical protein